MNLYQLRVRFAVDLPGGDHLADRLGRVGAIIVDRRPDPTPGPGRCGLVDAVVIDLTAPIDLPLIEHVLRPAGLEVLDLRPTDHRPQPIGACPLR